jgi:hypothetical protein
VHNDHCSSRILVDDLMVPLLMIYHALTSSSHRVVVQVHHGVRIRDSALVAAAQLSHRYISDRFLPDKAIVSPADPWNLLERCGLGGCYSVVTCIPKSDTTSHGRLSVVPYVEPESS